MICGSFLFLLVMFWRLGGISQILIVSISSCAKIMMNPINHLFFFVIHFSVFGLINRGGLVFLCLTSMLGLTIFGAHMLGLVSNKSCGYKFVVWMVAMRCTWLQRDNVSFFP